MWPAYAHWAGLVPDPFHITWMYRDYAKDASYSDAESAAQARRVGIWRDARPVPPWAFRRAGRNRAL